MSTMLQALVVFALFSLSSSQSTLPPFLCHQGTLENDDGTWAMDIEVKYCGNDTQLCYMIFNQTEAGTSTSTFGCTQFKECRLTYGIAMPGSCVQGKAPGNLFACCGDYQFIQQKRELFASNNFTV